MSRKQLNNTKPAPAGLDQVQQLQSTSESTPGGTESKRVVIDGVIFQFEEGGKQLTRIGGELIDIVVADLPELPSAGSSGSQGTPTRHRLKYGGEQYRRTKNGNLVSRAACVLLAPLHLPSNTRLSARRAGQAKKHCRFYTKTGACHQLFFSMVSRPCLLLRTDF